MQVPTTIDSETGTTSVAPYVILPRQTTGNSPFFAQYLAQDADEQAMDEQQQPSPALWGKREAAYRQAATPAPESQINIQI